ncbi:MAG TPA: molybdate ABC transporter substrate-binding protein [Tepidisphaeraceae bacterium]|nr:molybdate ABC transporter substrate-binding protein [Tepidisphaeraceae bacterium]
MWVVRAAAVSLFCALMMTGSGCRKQSASESQAGSQTGTPELRIAAASDLKFALDQISNEFRREHPQIAVQITYGSSGNFYSQLINKAPFDLYLSADVSYPRKLIDAGIGEHSAMFPYAVGRIVIWVPNDSPLDIGKLGFAALRDPGMRKIAIANPAHAPYGRAAQAALQFHEMWDSLQPKLVFGENIAQTAQFVQTGAADAGIIALSLAIAPSMKSAGRYYLIPKDEYPPLEQAGLILPWARDRSAAEAFRAFLTGPSGQAILKKFGFDTTAP